MKITVLLRYPRAERSAWKRDLLQRLAADGHSLSVVFGEASLFRQGRAALREYGWNIFRRGGRPSAGKSSERLWSHCRAHYPTAAVNDLNGATAERRIRETDPEYLLLLGTGIIRRNILSIPLHHTIHCHHGHLPEYRGVCTAEWSIYHGDDVYITTHLVDPGVDTGAVLMERKIAIESPDTIEAVRLRCRTESVDLLVNTFRGLTAGTIQPRPQAPGMGRQYYRMHPFFRTRVKRMLAEVAP